MNVHYTGSRSSVSFSCNFGREHSNHDNCLCTNQTGKQSLIVLPFRKSHKNTRTHEFTLSLSTNVMYCSTITLGITLSHPGKRQLRKRTMLNALPFFSWHCFNKVLYQAYQPTKTIKPLVLIDFRKNKLAAVLRLKGGIFELWPVAVNFAAKLRITQR